jgi:hypothetical protein
MRSVRRSSVLSEFRADGRRLGSFGPGVQPLSAGFVWGFVAGELKVGTVPTGLRTDLMFRQPRAEARG